LTQGLQAVDAATSDAASMEALSTLRAELRSLYEQTLARPAVDDAHRAALSRLAP
jgi:hypothetical protein